MGMLLTLETTKNSPGVEILPMWMFDIDCATQNVLWELLVMFDC